MSPTEFAVPFEFAKPLPPTWDELSSVPALLRVFEERFADSRGRGIDRIGAKTFATRLPQELATISQRAVEGDHRFTPYLERLATKTAESKPRQLSVPSLRDRLVLFQLKEYLHAHLPESVERTLPNEYIRDLKAFCQTAAVGELSVLRADIRGFYDSIPKDGLLTVLKARINEPRVFRLLKAAISTPTVSLGTHRPMGGWRRRLGGVPQGLAISNALANTYLISFDDVIRSRVLFYRRYVDDILLVFPSAEKEAVEAFFQAQLTERRLAVNEPKTKLGPLSGRIEYLGYAIHWPSVSVRRNTVEKYLRAVAGIITDYRFRVFEKRAPAFLTPDLDRTVFLDELNEKISGAISDTRRYGWLFYFAEMDDVALLHSMDHAIAGMMRRVPGLTAPMLSKVKRLVRAHFEGRHSPERGYILDYNALNTVALRLAFLVRRGRIDPASMVPMTDADINKMFEQYRNRQLHRLEMDVGTIS